MITVIGSLNMDLVVTAKRAPEQGETVAGLSFDQFPGGKGANQALAAARSGTETALAGRVGRDAFGQALIQALSRDSLDLSALEEVAEAPTGIAAITVDEAGHNRIVVVPGANGTFSASQMEAFRPLLAASNVLLLQFEIPMDAVEAAIVLAREEGTFCMVNPAPAEPLADHLYPLIDLLTPNETELSLLTGESDWRLGGRKLIARGLETLVVTLGAQGSLAMKAGTQQLTPAYRVKMVDSTAAGDCFNGSLAAGIDAMMGAKAPGRQRFKPSLQDLAPALDRASRAAAMSVTRRGAQPSIPLAEEIDNFDAWYPLHRL